MTEATKFVSPKEDIYWGIEYKLDEMESFITAIEKLLRKGFNQSKSDIKMDGYPMYLAPMITPL